MITKEQLRALEAAVDVAYDGTPSDDAERLEMENQARQGLEYLKPVVEAPKPEGRRWRILSNSTKGAGILQCVKAMMGVDPRHRIVLMPEVDYDRISARILYLEKQNVDMRAAILKGDKRVMELEDEIDNLNHERNVEYVAPVETESMDAAQERVLAKPPALEAPYGGEKSALEKHKETCKVCSDEPLNICPIGAILLRRESADAAANG